MFDYLIRNAMLADGTGTPAVKGDLAVQGAQIAAIGQLPAACAAHVIDAQGMYLTPGFLDIHRHADDAIFRPGFGRAELAQGLTTIVNGNCGLSLAPVPMARRPEIYGYLTPVTGLPAQLLPTQTMQSYLDAVGTLALPLNAGMLVGGGTVRAAAAGFAPEPLDAAALHEVHRLLEESLSGGALGVSLGLGYAPECFYTTQQLIDALAPLHGSGVPITVHMRQEGAGVVEALEEMMTAARALQTPVHISHLKSIGKAYWGRYMPRMLEILTHAREDGLDVSCDLYPYTAGSTQLIHVLPPESQDGGLAALTKNLREPAFRAKMRERMLTGTDFENLSLLVGWENIDVSTVKKEENRRFVGRNIAQIAQAEGLDPFDFTFDLLASEDCTVTMIDRITSDADICAALRVPFSSVISDATYPTSGLLHPRVYGNCTHLIEQYVLKQHVLTLEQAVRKLTGLPAQVLGLRTKGRLAVGMDADLCLFDPQALHETATWQSPAQLSAGMRHVFVGGVPAIWEGQFTDAANGRVLRR